MSYKSKIESKLEALTNMIEVLASEIESLEDKKVKLRDLLEQQEDLQISINAIKEAEQAKDDMFREILNELAVKATAGGITIADIKTAAETAEIKLDGVFEPEADEEEAQEVVALATG